MISESKRMQYDLMARFTANMVAEIIAKRHNIDLNEAISRFSKSSIYERLLLSETELWLDNPSDIADMFDMENSGNGIDPSYYFK